MRAVLEPPVNAPAEQLEDNIIGGFPTLWSQAGGDQERQNQLLSQLKDKLSAIGIECSQLAIRHGTSLKIIIICRSMEQLKQLYKHYINGVLKDVLEAVFILKADQDVKIFSLEWKQEQYNKCLRQLGI